MRRSAAVLLVLPLLTGWATAGDLGATGTPPAAPVAEPDWTGFYVGVSGGLAGGAFEPEVEGESLVESNAPEADDGLENGLVGLEFGYDHQIGSAVLGVVGDVNVAPGSD